MLSESASTSLSSASLPHVDPAVSVPEYDRSALRPSIVHVGVGGFHRAHLATYIDDLCRAGHTDWAIVGSGVMAGDARMADVLEAQDGLYTLISRGPNDTTVEVIGSLIEYIHAHPDGAELEGRIADPRTQIVSLTITEGGYPVDDVTGDFVESSPNAGPGSAFAHIAAGLDRRRTEGGSPVTVLSCDNIMSNGKVTRTALLGEAARTSPELVAWIDDNVSFPNGMVDRITPATSPSDSEWLAQTHHIEDRWPVVAEPFRQWVIEDSFAGQRLPLEDIDVIVTNDVEPYELMKLRLLNAGHSCLAYLAALDGIVTVDEAMAEVYIRKFVSSLLHTEAKPVLPHVAGIDVDEYIELLLERFANPSVGDQISRLCLDGSSKFPKFLLPTVRAQLAANGPISRSALALAGWCLYLNGEQTDGTSIDIAPDPNLEAAREYAAKALDDPAAFLGFTTVFGGDLAQSSRFTSAFADALSMLRAKGVDSAIAATLDNGG